MGIFGSGEEKTDKFIVQLIEQSKKTNEAIIFLEHSLDDDAPTKIEHVNSIINEIDEIRNVLLDDLHNTFITPIDREDILNISNALYDMVDYVHTTMDEMHILNVKPDQYIHKMVVLIRKQTEELLLAMERLSKNPRVAEEHALKTKSLEKEVERQYRKALRDLFIEPVTLENIKSIFFKREVYRHLSNMSDRADTAANIFSVVVMKLS